MALLDFAQRFVDAVRSDDAASAKSAFVFFGVLRHLTIAQPVIFGSSRGVTSGRRNHAAFDATLVEIADEFRHSAGNQVPLKNLAVIAGNVQMRVKNAAAGLGLDPAFEGFAESKIRQRNDAGANHLSAGE